MAITLSGEIGRAVRTVIGIITRPIQTRDRCAVFSQGDGRRIKADRFGRAQQPGQRRTVQDEGTRLQPSLPASGRRIELREHDSMFPAANQLKLVRRKLGDFVKMIYKEPDGDIAELGARLVLILERC